MTDRSRQRGIGAVVESWWPLARDIAAFLLGSSILLWQTVVEQEAQAVLVTAATALLGLPIVGQVQRSARKKENEETAE